MYFIACGSQNTKNICIGQTNIKLNDKSTENIIKLKNTLKSNIKATIYTSDLDIAIDSCKLFCNNSVKITEYNVDANLRELNFGLWDGLLWDDIYHIYSEDLSNFSKDWINNRPTKGECFLDVINRAKIFIDKLDKDAINKETILIFTHPTFIRAIICSLLEVPLDRAYSFKIDYGSVYNIKYNVCNKEYEFIYSNLPIIM